MFAFDASPTVHPPLLLVAPDEAQWLPVTSQVEAAVAWSPAQLAGTQVTLVPLA
ncbi:MAG: hypothetical protein ACHREM_19665 [Polyangiales bacterium]